jgi:hypothetical protein
MLSAGLCCRWQQQHTTEQMTRLCTCLIERVVIMVAWVALSLSPCSLAPGYPGHAMVGALRPLSFGRDLPV